MTKERNTGRTPELEGRVILPRNSKLGKDMEKKEKNRAKETIDEAQSFALLYETKDNYGCVCMMGNPVKMLKLLNRLRKHTIDSIKKITDEDIDIDFEGDD
jgi:hypothetical protein